jgi:DNA-binding beta-propeller fold protein YncE
MSVRRAVFLAAMVLPILVWMACGQVYRPVVIPCSTGGVPGCPVESAPQPSNFHSVFGITTNSPNFPGGALQIDVAGDSIIGETPTSQPSQANLGNFPTHAAISANDSQVFVASAGTVLPGGLDVVSYFTPVFQSTQTTGLGTVGTIALPSQLGQSSSIVGLSEAGNVVTATLTTPLYTGPNSTTLVAVGTSVVIAGESISGYNGTYVITGISPTTLQYTDSTAGLAACPSLTAPCTAAATASIPGQPVYLASTESAEMYVANYNSNSVTKISTSTDVVTQTAAVGVNPVAMAEIPGTTQQLPKLYIANQGNNTISSLNTADLSSNVVTGFAGVTPVWVVARGDAQKVYVLTQGDGMLVTIDVGTDTVTSSLPVGAGANFIFYDPYLNRLYVTNPVTNTVYVFSDTSSTSDVPSLLATIPITVASGTCPHGAPCRPVSVTALPDGTRFYVASYATAAPCPDSNVSGACLIPSLSIFNANTFAPQYPGAAASSMTLLSPTSTAFAATQYAVPSVASCATAPLYPALYTPGVTRFRMFTVASVDSSKVFVGMCDAGGIAVIDTSGANTNNPGTGTAADSLVMDLLAGYLGSGALQSNGEPAPQNPIFLFTGQ